MRSRICWEEPDLLPRQQPLAQDTTTTLNDDEQDLNLLHHPIYYISIVTFRVENTLFKVPQHVFEAESNVLGDLFLKHGKETTPRRIGLPGVSVYAFECFLKVLYPIPISSNVPLNEDGWIHVLKLSCDWEFKKVKLLAMNNLESLDPVLKLELSKEKHIMESEWIYPAVSQLVQRREPLNEEEANKIGVPWFIKVNRVRESHQKLSMIPILPRVFLEVLIEREFKLKYS